jgi:hypothetical protein
LRYELLKAKWRRGLRYNTGALAPILMIHFESTKSKT